MSNIPDQQNKKPSVYAAHFSRAKLYRSIALSLPTRLVALLFLAMFLLHGSGAFAAPIVDNNSGFWLDVYDNQIGIFESNNVQVSAGTVQMISPGSGFFTTTEIKPRSFDEWTKLTLDATIPTGASIAVDLLDANNGNAPISGWTGLTPANGEISLSTLPISFDNIRAKFTLTSAGTVTPFVNRVELTWHPVSLLLMDKSAPAEVQAGETIIYKIRYSVSYAQANNLVIWDTLPNEGGGATNGVIYPADGTYADADQEDAPTFVSADGGGQYCAVGSGGCAVGSPAVLVPENSVYWELGNVAEGTTATLNVKVKSQNGAIDGTTYLNQSMANADNLSSASQIASNVVSTALRSIPAPNIEKRASGALVAEVAEDRYYAAPSSTIRFVIADPVGSLDGNDYAATGRERMYNTVIYDDLSDIFDAANVDTTQGAGGVFNISNGGFFDATYVASDGGVPFPAVVWEDVNNGATEQGLFEPGDNYYLTFEVSLLDPIAETEFDNRVCIDSDQTDPVCDQITVETEIDYTVSGIYAKGDELDSDRQVNFGVNDDPNQFIVYGDTIRYLHRVDNTLAVNVNNTVIFDMIPPNTTFSSASLSAVANGRVFYSTDASYTDPAVAPPIDASTMPTAAGAINQPVSANLGPGWLDLATTPPANPADVTWVAFYIPQVSSYTFDYNNPISLMRYAELNVTTDVPPFPDICVGRQIDNYGLFTAYGSSLPGGDVRPPDNGERYEAPADHEITIIKPEVAEIELNSTDVTLTVPDGDDLPAEAVYTLRITNENRPTSDTALNTRLLLTLGQLPVNGVNLVPQYTSVTVNDGPASVTSWNQSSGALEIALGTMPKGSTKNIELRVQIPVGVLNGTNWSVDAQVTADDDLCSPPPETISIQEPIATRAELNVFKNQNVSLIPSGGSIDYALTFFNNGTSPSEGTYVVDQIPDKMVFEYATSPNGETVYISDALPPDLPASQDPFDPISRADFLSGGPFVPAAPHPTIANAWVCPSNWSVAQCEGVTWVGWLVDDPQTGIFPVGAAQTVGLTVRNDEVAGNGQEDGSPPATQLFNEASIFADGLLPAIGNEVVATILDSPGLVLSKQGPTPNVVAAGETFDWVIGYHNDSESPDIIVNITDTLPSGLTFIGAQHAWNAEAASNGAPADNSGATVPTSTTVNLDGTTEIGFAIAPNYRGSNLLGAEGGTITLTVQVEPWVTTGTQLTNHVCGIAENELAEDINTIIPPCANATVLVQNPDLATFKTVSPPDPASGDTVLYEIRISNQGPNVAQNVTISDTLPSGVTYQNMVSTSFPPGNGYDGLNLSGPTVSGQTLTWTLDGGPMPGNLTNPGTISIIFEVTVDADVPPGTTLTNNACVETSNVDENSANDCDETPIRTPHPDPTLSKDVDAVVVQPGEPINWTIEYGNNNNEDAAGVYVIDTLPDLTYVDTRGERPNGAGGVEQIPVGDIWYSNAPIAPTFNYTTPTASGWSNAATAPVRHIAYVIGDLPRRSGPYAIEIESITVDPDTGINLLPGTKLTNTAEIVSVFTIDDNPNNNKDDANTRIPGVDMALTKIGSTEGSFPGVAPGTPLVYTIGYENRGTVVSYGIRITDTLPAHLNFDPATVGDSFATIVLENGVDPVDQNGAVISNVPVTWSLNGRTISWQLGGANYADVGIPPGARGSFDLYVTISNDAPNSEFITNPACVAVDNPGIDPEEYLANNCDETSVLVGRPEVIVDKMVVGPQGELTTTAGSMLTYTIGYNNIGNIGAENVVIDEIIPAGTRYVAGSLTVPQNATVAFFPNAVDPDRFEIRFDALPAPSTFYDQDRTDNWLINDLEGISVPTNFVGSQQFNDTNIYASYTTVAADLNGDGFDDLVVGNAEDNANELYLNDGAGGFLMPTIFSTGTDLQKLIAFDMDGDGDLDIASANSDTDVHIVANDGAGNLTIHDTFFPLDEYYDLVALDVDTDGDLDLIMANHDFNTIVFNDGAGNFSVDTLGTDFAEIDSNDSGTGRDDTWALETFDADSDGDLDVAVGNAGQDSLYRNNGDGTFTVVNAFSPDFTRDVAFLDANGDGALDVAVATENGFNYLYLNDGSGNFSPWDGADGEAFSGGENDTWSIHAADMDGDGDVDIITGNIDAANGLWINNGDGTFSGEKAFTDFNNTATYNITTLDVNNDRLPDVVVGIKGPNELYINSGGAAICLQMQNDLYADGVTQFTGSGPNSRGIDAVDVDGDGDIDLAVAVEEVGVVSQIYVNDGSGNFAPSPLPAGIPLATSIKAFDADGDLDMDLVIGRRANGLANILLINDGAGNYTQIDSGDFDDVPVGDTGNSQTYDVEPFDADGDGDIDLAVANFWGYNYFYLNDGDGTYSTWDGGAGIAFSAAGGNGSGAGSTAMAAFDADGDGDQDIVVANAEVAGDLPILRNELYLNDGAGNFTPSPDAGDLDSVGGNWAYSVEAFDADGDGDIDLAFGNGEDTKNTFFRNNGAGSFTLTDAGAFSETISPNAGNEVHALATADIDGDGDLDIVVPQNSNIPSQILLNDGTGYFTPWDLISGAELKSQVTYSTVDVAIFDANGDGFPDIATSNLNGSAPNELFTHLRNMNSAVVTSTLISPASLYPNSGALRGWTYVIIEDTMPDQTSITYDVLDAAGNPVAGFTGLRPDATNRIDLAGLDAATHPAIYLRANFLTEQNPVSPQLCRWTTIFDMDEQPSFTFNVIVDEPPALDPAQVLVENDVCISTDTPEIDPNNNCAEDNIAIYKVDVSIDKIVNTQSANVGEIITYTLAYANESGYLAENVWITDTLPMSVTYTAGEAQPTETNFVAPNVLGWSLGNLAPFASGEIIVPVELQSGIISGTWIINPAVIETDTPETDYTNNSSNDRTIVGDFANVLIEKSGPASVPIGGPIVYTLAYANTGNVAATNVAVNDTLPSGVTFDSAIPAPSSITGNRLAWDNLGATPGTLGVEESGTITVFATIDLDAGLVDQPTTVNCDPNNPLNNLLDNRAEISTITPEVDSEDNRDNAETCPFLEPARISGHAWLDTNGDVVWDATETPLDTVLITLSGTDIFGDSILITTTTNADGYYSFTNLNPGTYSVVESSVPAYADSGSVLGEVQPASSANSNGSIPNGDPNRFDEIVLSAGNNGVEYNFAEKPGSIGDTVWLDLNGDGAQDPDEPGLPNVLVTLTASDGTTVSTRTDANGTYRFDNLPAGRYTVAVNPATLPAGVAQTYDLDGTLDHSTIYELEAGEHVETVDFGYQPLTIGDYVWFDENGDGIQNDGAPSAVGVAGVTVTLYDEAGRVISTTITGADGAYIFMTDSDGNTLEPGDYRIEFSQPAGYVFTLSVVGDTEQDSNANAQGQTALFSVGVGERQFTIDTGLVEEVAVEPITIGDFVWYDQNEDGVQQTSDEPGISGVTVTLLDALTMMAITTTVTNEAGRYLFATDANGDPLMPNTYIVEFATPAGYAATTPNASGNEATDSDVNPATGQTDSVTILSGENVRTMDAGYVEILEPTATPGPTATPTRISTSEPTATPESSVTPEPTATPDATATLEPTTVPDPLPTLTPTAVPGAAIQLDKTVYAGHDGGQSCVGAEVVRGYEGEAVTYCFVVTNTGETYLSQLEFVDDLLGITKADLTLIDGGEPLAPGDSISFFYESQIFRTVTNVATVKGTPSDENGDEFPNSDPVEDEDDAEVQDIGASIGDYVWLDANRNGTQDYEEVGLPNVAVNLYDGEATLLKTTMTNEEGLYLFDDLRAGTYLVEFIPPVSPFEDYVLTKRDAGDDRFDSDADPYNGRTLFITLADAEDNRTVDAGVIAMTPQIEENPVARLLGTVWHDSNRDGVQDGLNDDTPDGEQGLGDIPVYLYTSTGSLAATTTTDSDGTYEFVVISGDYYVVFDPPIKWQSSPQDQGDDRLDSDMDPETYRTETVSVLVKQETVLDAGLYQEDTLATVTGIVWFDINQDGIRDETEQGIPGVPVHLYIGNGLKIADTLSDEDGAVTFSDLPAGDYQLRYEVPARYEVSPRDQGADESRDSDIAPQSGFTRVFSVQSGEKYEGSDAGIFETAIERNTPPDVVPSALTGVVWQDSNRDGQRTDDEPIIPNVEVILYNDSGVEMARTTTDDDAVFIFNNLTPGEYFVQFVRPDQATATKQDVGSNLTDSDIDIRTGRTAEVGVPLGITVENVDAGFIFVPTAIELATFMVMSTDDGNYVRWTTSYEDNSAGFYVYRSQYEQGLAQSFGSSRAVLLTPVKILAEDSQSGASYEYVDRSAEMTREYSYWLVEEDGSGMQTVYGPVSRFSGFERSDLFMPIVGAPEVMELVAGQSNEPRSVIDLYLPVMNR